MQLGIGLQ